MAWTVSMSVWTLSVGVSGYIPCPRLQMYLFVPKASIMFFTLDSIDSYRDILLHLVRSFSIILGRVYFRCFTTWLPWVQIRQQGQDYPVKLFQGLSASPPLVVLSSLRQRRYRAIY